MLVPCASTSPNQAGNGAEDRYNSGCLARGCSSTEERYPSQGSDAGVESGQPTTSADLSPTLE